MSEPQFRLDWSVIVTVVAWLVGGMLIYGSLNSRISVLEDRNQRFAADIDEIKSDIKILIRRDR